MKFLIVIALNLFITVFSTAGVVDDLLVDLADEDYSKRKVAHEKIKKWAFENQLPGVRLLVDKQSESKSPEVKARLGAIILSVRAKFSQIGAMGAEFDEAPNGVKVKNTFVGMAAHKAGIQRGDVIEQMGSLNLSKFSVNPADILYEFNSKMLDTNMGEKMNLKVRRGKKLINIEIILSARKEQTKLLYKDHKQSAKLQFHIEPEKGFKQLRLGE